MVDEKPTVTVKMKVGEMEFQIECDVNELRGVVDTILASVAESGVRASLTAGANERAGMTGYTGRGETCKSIISSLWREGWFREGRSMGEVHSEMGRRGFHYDRTAVAHTLVDLVREGIMTRIGRPRRYRYLQKRPPPSQASEP